MKVCTNELLNLSVATINSILEDIMDLLQDESNLSSPYTSVFAVIISSRFFKILLSIFLKFITRDCLAE